MQRSLPHCCKVNNHSDYWDMFCFKTFRKVITSCLVCLIINILWLLRISNSIRSFLLYPGTSRLSSSDSLFSRKLNFTHIIMIITLCAHLKILQGRRFLPFPPKHHNSRPSPFSHPIANDVVTLFKCYYYFSFISRSGAGRARNCHHRSTSVRVKLQALSKYYAWHSVPVPVAGWQQLPIDEMKRFTFHRC